MKFLIDLQFPKPKVFAQNGGACVIEGKDQTIVVICDGLGSWVRGGEAAVWAVQQLCELNLGSREQTIEDCSRYLNRISKEAGEQFPMSDQNKYVDFSACCLLLSAAGTTSLIPSGTYELALIRDGKVMQKSRIRRWIDTQIEAGNLNLEQAKNHAYRNIIQCPEAGLPPHISEVIGPWQIQPGDELWLMEMHKMEREMGAHTQPSTPNPNWWKRLHKRFTSPKAIADNEMPRSNPFTVIQVLES